MLYDNRLRSWLLPAALAAFAGLTGCNSIINGWLDPTELGSYTRESTLEIRDSLSIQDTPRGVRGTTEPTPEDLIPTADEYRLVPGDVVNVFIFELRQVRNDSAMQTVVDTQGRINLPVLKWVKAAGLTAEELEEEIKDILEERDIIHDAEVLVQYAAQRGLTYTIFGNETLAVRLNRGPGVFPIPRPDFRLLDALSVSGGLSELVDDIYVFRQTERDVAQRRAVIQTRLQEGIDDPTDARSPVEKPEKPTPPPLPSVLASNRAGAAAITGAAYGQTPPQPAPVPPTQPPPDAPKEEKPIEPAEKLPDVQEIIDLMSSEPSEKREKQSTDDVKAPPADTPSTPAPQPTPVPPPSGTPEQDKAGVPTKWIFLNGEWIEAAPDPSVPPPPPPPPAVRRGPQAEGIEPAIDWESIANEESAIRLIRISGEGLRSGDPRYNIVVRAGDVIRLYSGDIGFYYMTGHVARPGVYTFRGGSTITLKNAVGGAGGLDPLGWPDRVTVYRRIGEREQMIQVNLDRIFAGAEPDFYLKKDDIVNVGTHPIAPYVLQLRNLTIPQTGGSITYFYRYVRQETFFKNEDLAAPNQPGLFP